MRQIPPRKGRLPHRGPHPERKLRPPGPRLRLRLPQDDFDFLIAALNDVSLELVEKKEAKQEELFHQITGEFKEAQQALQSSQAVSMAPLTMEISGTGDEPTQLRQITEKVEARLRRAQEDIAKATQALVQAQSTHEEQQRKEEQEQLDLQAKWEEEKSQLQQSKDQLLAEQLETQERVHKALRSVTIIEVKMEDHLPQQVTQLEAVIQQLQQCIMDLELRTMPETPQEIRDLREATARSAVDRLKTLASECRQLSTRSTQTYETLAENP
jgi:hypothetical protein